jgi:hypothetical protein
MKDNTYTIFFLKDQFFLLIIKLLAKQMLNCPDHSHMVWTSDCFRTPNEEFFSNVMERIRYIRRNYDVTCFVLDQHAHLNVYGSSSLK